MVKSIKKILILTSTFPRWEGDREPVFIYELCQKLNRRYEVHVLAPHIKGALKEEIMDDICVHRFQYFLNDYQSLAYSGGILARIRQNKVRMLLIPFFVAAQQIALIKLLKSQNFDYINAHWIIPNAFSAVAVKLLTGYSPPVICTSHGGDLFALKGKLFSMLKRWVLDHCLKVIVVSEAMRKVLLDMGLPPDRISVISMGVDLKEKFIPSRNTPKQKNMIIFAGRLVEKKGLTYLLHAVHKVRVKHPGLELLIAGDGPERSSLELQVRELNISENVKFTGALTHDELIGFYQKATIAVFPFVVASDGDQEGLGLVVIEAMGCECAVIASDLPAVHDSVIDNVNGFMATPGDINNLADLIGKLLDNPDYAWEMGKTARKSIITRFDWSVIGEKYGAVFNSDSDRGYQSTSLNDKNS